jgi:hypothetical protein
MNPPPSQQVPAKSGALTEPRPWKLLALTGALLVMDFGLGPYIQFPVFFVVPVMLTAWFYNTAWAVAVALILAGGRFLFHWYWQFPVEVMPAALNTVMRGLVFVVIAYVTASTAVLVRRLRGRISELEAQLPVCPECGLVQNDGSKWVDAGVLPPKPRCLCPSCEERRYGMMPRGE